MADVTARSLQYEYKAVSAAPEGPWASLASAVRYRDLSGALPFPGAVNPGGVIKPTPGSVAAPVLPVRAVCLRRARCSGTLPGSGGGGELFWGLNPTFKFFFPDLLPLKAEFSRHREVTEHPGKE